jgi:hypothetical protein
VARAAREFDDTPRAVEKLGEALQLRAPSSLKWQTQVISGEDHGTALLPGVQAGLEFVLADWRLPTLVFDEGLDSIEQYYQQLSAKYGFRVPIPKGEISVLATQTHEPKSAIRIYERYTQIYPQSVTAFAGLPESLDSGGDLRRANNVYIRAAELANADHDPRLAELKQHQDPVIARLKVKP